MAFENHDEPLAHTLNHRPNEALTSLPAVDSLPTPEESATITEVSYRNSLALENENENSHAHQAKSALNDLAALGPDKVKPLWRVWLLEVASILTSICLLVVIIVIFSRYDSQGLPDWPLEITLNTFAAFISMASKAAFILPVSVAIAQGQWDWFRQEQPLYDFYVFDQASRGPWGSLVFLRRIHLRHIASIGAFLMVVSALTSPITQLAISYPVREIEVQGNAAVAISPSMLNMADAQTIAQKSTIFALSMDSTAFLSPISPVGIVECSTGNCTFDNYSSLGVCMEMANITSQLAVERIEDYKPLGIPLYDDTVKEYAAKAGAKAGAKVWKASLAEDLLLIHQHDMAMILDILNGNETYGFRGRTDLLPTRLASFAMIYSNPISKSGELQFENIGELVRSIQGVQHEAIEILFYLCAQSYKTEVRVGQESTELIGSLVQPRHKNMSAFLSMDCERLSAKENKFSSVDCQTDISRFQETLYLESPCNPPKTDIKSVNSCTLGANYSGLLEMTHIMRQALTGTGMAVPEPPQNPVMLTNYLPTNPVFWVLFSYVLYSPASINNMTAQSIRIKNLFTNIATALSTEIRSHKGQTDAYNITGQAWSTQSYVRINWRWISFLAVEIVIAAIFLTLTIAFQFKRQEQEKNDGGSLSYRDAKDSSLAHLVALGDQCREKAGGGPEAMSKLEKFTKGFKVKLQGNEIVPSGDIDD